jgi:hypothetical protein
MRQSYKDLRYNRILFHSNRSPPVQGNAKLAKLQSIFPRKDIVSIETTKQILFHVGFHVKQCQEGKTFRANPKSAILAVKSGLLYGAESRILGHLKSRWTIGGI